MTKSVTLGTVSVGTRVRSRLNCPGYDLWQQGTITNTIADCWQHEGRVEVEWDQVAIDPVTTWTTMSPKQRSWVFPQSLKKAV